MVRIFGILATIHTGRLFKVDPKKPGVNMWTGIYGSGRGT
jgi:hypothetical protein